MVFLCVSHFDDHTVVNFASVWPVTVLVCGVYTVVNVTSVWPIALLVCGDYTVFNVTSVWLFVVLWGCSNANNQTHTDSVHVM